MGLRRYLRGIFSFIWPFKGLYNECNLDKTQRRTLNALVLGPFFANAWGVLTNGTVLAAFQKKLNVTDFTFGLMNSLPIIATGFYMMGSWVLERTGKRKKVYIVSTILSRSVWFLIAAMPWVIPMQAQLLRIWTLIILMTSGAMFSQFGNCSAWTWTSEAVPVSIQGRFLASRGSMINIVIMTVSLLISLMLDAIGNSMLSYTIAFSIGASMGIIEALCFVGAREKPIKPMTTAYLSAMKVALKNRGFVKMMAYWTIYFFILCMGNSFYARYMLGPLSMSVTMCTFITMVLSGLVSSFALPFWGKLLDRHGRHWVIPRSLLITTVVGFLWLLVKPGQFWWVALFFVGLSLSHSGLDLAQQQAVIGTAARENRSIYIGLFGAVNGVLGIFPGVFMAGVILRWLGDFTISWGPLHMDRYQIFFIGTILLRLILLVGLLPMISRGNQEHREEGEPDAVSLG